MDVSHLLDDLNPAQREVVSAPPGHALVLAGDLPADGTEPAAALGLQPVCRG